MTPDTQTIDCRAAMRQLYDYLDGELNEQTAQLVRDHVERCKPCYAHVVFERELLAVIADGWRNVAASASLKERIKAQLSSESH
jgi:anti-sigma factor (TIGR02949 family)